MILVRINGESQEDNSVFSIDYKNLYDELGQKFVKKNTKCLLDILGLIIHSKTLLFQYTESDDNLSEDKEFFQNSYFESYHNHGYKNITDEVKDILIKHYKNKRGIKLQDMEGIREELFNDLKSIPVEDIDKDLLGEIKHFIYKKHFKTIIADYSEGVQDFIDMRVVAVDYDYRFRHMESYGIGERPVDFIRDLWIRMNSKEDIDYWFKNISGYFVCLINDKNSIEDYEYLIKYDWGWINNNETLLLDVLERNKGDFIKEVFTLMEKSLGVEVKEIDYFEKR